MDCLRRETAAIGEEQREYVAIPMTRKDLLTQSVLMSAEWVS